VEIAVAGGTPSEMHAAVEAAFGAIATVHGLMSFHEADSDVGRINREAAARAVCVHDWTFAVLEAAVDLGRQSAGVFDITVAPVLQGLGLLPRWETEGSSRVRNSETPGVELLPGRRVRFHRSDTQIDLGGIAKGFAVDRAIDVLRERGMPAGLVNAGGDLAAFGPDAEKVDIRDPHDPSRLLLCLKIGNQALASSAPRFDPLQSATATGTAIIDPSTRRLVEGICAATVCAPSCMIADALTKVVMIAGPSAGQLLDHYRAGALIVSATGGVQMTEDLQDAVCLAA